MKKLHKDKSVTQGDLDELGAAIIRGVSEELTRFATKDEITVGFSRLEKRMDTLEDKVDTLDTKVSDIHRRTRDLEGDTAGLRQVIDHERRIKKLESHVFAHAA